jgi:hypothetical protein
MSRRYRPSHRELQARYRGRNEAFPKHQGVVTFVWAVGAPQMRCTLKP